MLKFILLFLLSTSAFASTLILEKHASSGYTLPEYSFVKDCKIYREGRMESTTLGGDGTTTSFSRKVSAMHINTIRALNLLALAGEIVETPMPCDIGTTLIKGYTDTQVVELELAMDCGQKRTNESAAAYLLRSMAREICGF
jgi:hypothetical protein